MWNADGTMNVTAMLAEAHALHVKAEAFEVASAMTRDDDASDRYGEIANRLYNRSESLYYSAMEIRYNVQ